MTPQGVVEITLHFHFNALLSATASFTLYNLQKEEGSIPLCWCSGVPRKFLVKWEILSRRLSCLKTLHLQGDVLSQMERMLAALLNRFKANGILVTPQVALS